MATGSRTIPIGTPQVPGRVVGGIQAAIADPASRPQAYIRLRASGGVRGERYEFEYTVDAAGRAQARLLDELKDRRHATPAPAEAAASKAADPRQFATLARALDIESLMRAESPAGNFPPDSVVGRLEVSDGEQTATFLRKAVDAVFRSAAKALGTEDVRP
jgi:hypothetical protein